MFCLSKPFVILCTITMWEYFVQKCIKLEPLLFMKHVTIVSKKYSEVTTDHDQAETRRESGGYRLIILKISACLWIDNRFIFHLIHLIPASKFV